MTSLANAARTGEPEVLPSARGPLSAAVLEALRGARDSRPALPRPADADPFGDDVQLALHLCYELHYQGLPQVSDDWEWDTDLLRFRAGLEHLFLTGIRSRVASDSDAQGEVDRLLIEPAEGGGIAHHLATDGEWWQMREFFAHRSVYHLKEADPQLWAVPRLRGRAKAALVAVEFDEFGGGRADRMHSQLYADLMVGAALDPRYLHYLDAIPAPALAWVNMMSLFGLHRSLRGASVGHFAAAEITTAPSARRMVAALRRLGAAEACVHFYTEHIEADAVHEQMMRHDVIADLLRREPELAADVALGVRATELIEDDFARHLLRAWAQDRTSLRSPLAPPEAA